MAHTYTKNLEAIQLAAASSSLRSNLGSVIKQANIAKLLASACPRSVRIIIIRFFFL
jgi:hypothetical protein